MRRLAKRLWRKANILCLSLCSSVENIPVVRQRQEGGEREREREARKKKIGKEL